MYFYNTLVNESFDQINRFEYDCIYHYKLPAHTQQFFDAFHKQHRRGCRGASIPTFYEFKGPINSGGSV